MTTDLPRTLQLFNDYHHRFDELLVHLNEELLPSLITSLNNSSPQHFGKLDHEPLPKNERNLTDARTRIGVLLEYALAFALDDVLKHGDYRAGFLVANQFPDITTRHVGTFAQGVRLEVKAIQAVAEEKAANFGTLVRDILPEQDILCVLLWDWHTVALGTTQVDYPHIYRAFALDARVIAKIRDILWLSQTGDYQSPKLIDIAGALVPINYDADTTTYKLEEKNLGKLTRLIDMTLLAATTHTQLVELRNASSVAVYQDLIRTAYNFGIERVMRSIATSIKLKTGVSIDFSLLGSFNLNGFAAVALLESVSVDILVIGNDTGRQLSKDNLKTLIVPYEDNTVVIEMRPKFGWRMGIIVTTEQGKRPVRQIKSVRWQGISGKKPATLRDHLQYLISG
ncbi:hypothetical protein DVJ83_16425 (plasmid) [Deinococcus wulumuqiensis]|uniref:Uncharacterized protein n=1 Tax=Deinococcus wulumuqiensis TaxID=980427 RepID=A0A345IM07_9DEIO|nr:hypothetical protein [Deinococcus wulumuqiensis]AXH00730.1 hypothetical protein DVJ83_16425 [Deinococcus wulumuqiensis]